MKFLIAALRSNKQVEFDIWKDLVNKKCDLKSYSYRQMVIWRQKFISFLMLGIIVLTFAWLYDNYNTNQYIDYLIDFSSRVQNGNSVEYSEPDAIPVDYVNYDFENFVMLYPRDLQELFLNIENSEEEIEGWFACVRDSEEEDVCIPLQNLANFRLLDVEYYAQNSTAIQSRKQMKELLEKWR